VIDDGAATTEDVEREPDGMPHAVIGLTVLVSALLAVLCITLLWVDSLAAQIAVVTLVVVTLFVLVGRLQRKAARDRDHVHPSR
jgi:hypothetical protein